MDYNASNDVALTKSNENMDRIFSVAELNDYSSFLECFNQNGEITELLALFGMRP